MIICGFTHNYTIRLQNVLLKNTLAYFWAIPERKKKCFETMTLCCFTQNYATILKLTYYIILTNTLAYSLICETVKEIVS